VVRVVEVVVPRRLLLDDLCVRRARLAQLVSRAHYAVQPRALVKDAVPVYEFVHPAQRVAFGQLQRLPLGRSGGVRPLERLVQRVGMPGVGVEPAAQACVVLFESPTRGAQRARHAVSQRVEVHDPIGKARDE
jgi:hypothetical protein